MKIYSALDDIFIRGNNSLDFETESPAHKKYPENFYRRPSQHIDHPEYTPKERDSRGYYSAGSAINNYLRIGFSPDRKIPQHVKNLDNMLNKSRTNKDLTVYRSMGRSLKDLKPGDIINNEGFTSSTLHPSVATGIFSGGSKDYLAFHVPRGSKAMAVNSGDDPEYELLHPRNMRLQLDSINGHEHRAHIVGEQ